MSDEFRLDLHIHSRYSPDSTADLEAITAAITDAGLRGFALTDHNTTRGHAALAELRGRYRGYLFVPGVEVSTREGHLLGYGIAESPPRGLPVSEAIEWIQSRGGAVVLPHPFRRTHGVGRLVAETARVSAIEGRNGHNSELSNARAELVAAKRGIGSTGGSDAHRVVEVGRCHTVFPETVESVDDVIELLRRGHCHAEGRSLTAVGQLRTGMTAAMRRVRRGFKPV